MLPETAALNAGDDVDGQPTAGAQPHEKVGRTMKFAYKTGARPLDGYTIKRGVGIGGFGEVYFAVSDAGKELALKRIQHNLDVEVRGVRQCLNLKHPNLIALYDLKYDDEGQAWVVMEYVAGESLKDVVERNPNGLPQEDVEHWFGGIAAGVIYLHEHGIVHRDLKPGNIFDDEGVVKIGDYGLSKFMSASRRSGQTESVGTFHYMAPEIGRGVYGREIDVYALGIVLFEVLTGSVPFEGESSQEIIMKHLTDEPDLSAVPQPYRDVIQRALRKDPDKRFGTVQEMLAAVQACHHPDSAAAAGAAANGATGEGRATGGEPIYIGDDPEEKPPEEIAFGHVRQSDVVSAQLVPPVRNAQSKARPSRASHATPAAPAQSVSSAAASVARTAPAAARPKPVAASRPKHPAAPRHPRDAAGKNGMSGFGKLVLALAMIAVLFFNPQLIPVAAVVGMIYLIVLCVRAVSRARHRSAMGRRSAFAETALWKNAARAAMRRKPFSERVAELTGSMLAAACFVAVLNFVFLMVLGGMDNSAAVSGWSRFGWLTVVGTAGTWMLLLLGKFWEGTEGDSLRKYIALLVLGLVLGGVAFVAGEALMVSLPDQDQWTDHGLANAPWAQALYTSDGTPMLGAYLVYFAGLFAVLRWWTQVDPLRRARLSAWATGVCILWAWVMHMFCRFPQPWGLMLAASISVAAQLSSTWLHPRDRAEIGQGVNRA